TDDVAIPVFVASLTHALECKVFLERVKMRRDIFNTDTHSLDALLVELASVANPNHSDLTGEVVYFVADSPVTYTNAPSDASTFTLEQPGGRGSLPKASIAALRRPMTFLSSLSRSLRALRVKKIA